MAVCPSVFYFERCFSDGVVLKYQVSVGRSAISIHRLCCCCNQYTVSESLSIFPIDILCESFFDYLATGRLSYRSFSARKTAFHSFYQYLASNISISPSQESIYTRYCLHS